VTSPVRAMTDPLSIVGTATGLALGTLGFCYKLLPYSSRPVAIIGIIQGVLATSSDSCGSARPNWRTGRRDGMASRTKPTKHSGETATRRSRTGAQIRESYVMRLGENSVARGAREILGKRRPLSSVPLFVTKRMRIWWAIRTKPPTPHQNIAPFEPRFEPRFEALI